MKLPKCSTISLICLLLLPTIMGMGCSTMMGLEVDTLNKRILIAESTYSYVMDKVRVYVGDDRFSKEQLQSILPKVSQIRRALQSLQAAKELKDEVMAGDQVTIIMSILSIFKNYVAQADAHVSLEKDTSTEYVSLKSTINTNVWKALQEAELLL